VSATASSSLAKEPALALVAATAEEVQVASDLMSRVTEVTEAAAPVANAVERQSIVRQSPPAAPVAHAVDSERQSIARLSPPAKAILAAKVGRALVIASVSMLVVSFNWIAQSW
jgi:hypothetical protein